MEAERDSFGEGERPSAAGDDDDDDDDVDEGH